MIEAAQFVFITKYCKDEQVKEGSNGYVSSTHGYLRNAYTILSGMREGNTAEGKP
jgi:hypothetical protein